VEQLVGTEAERRPHRRIESHDRALEHVFEQVVEPALRTHGAVDEVGGEGAVAVVDTRLRQHGR